MLYHRMLPTIFKFQRGLFNREVEYQLNCPGPIFSYKLRYIVTCTRARPCVVKQGIHGDKNNGQNNERVSHDGVSLHPPSLSCFFLNNLRDRIPYLGQNSFGLSTDIQYSSGIVHMMLHLIVCLWCYIACVRKWIEMCDAISRQVTPCVKCLVLRSTI